MKTEKVRMSIIVAVIMIFGLIGIASADCPDVKVCAKNRACNSFGTCLKWSVSSCSPCDLSSITDFTNANGGFKCLKIEGKFYGLIEDTICKLFPGPCITCN